MSFAKRLSLFALVLTLASVIIICLSPFLVANGFRLFLWWKAREQGVKIEFQTIDAPFLKPVIIHALRVTSARPCLFRVDLTARQATFDLNLRSIFTRSNARILHSAIVDDLHCEIQRNPQQRTECNFDWHFLHSLLADQVKLTHVDLRVINGSTDFDLRGAEWSASEIESGRFAAQEVRIATPFFHQTFSNLQGATKWENDRLTLGALSLARGLDIETITADFSGLEKKRIGMEVNLDAFGGKLRASVASENRGKGIIWNVAGTASAISLVQMSIALGLPEPAGGSVRASKFTFRGDLQNLTHATASVWMEMSGFTWKDRVAETVMVGASLYNREIDVGQIYVKQRNNQFTLSGEYALPNKTSDWINPNFRADISASINDLGEFARLFGGSKNNFSGSLNISGTINGRESNLGGQIILDGMALQLWAAPLDSLHAKLGLKGSELGLESLQARHADDFFNATGQVNLLRNHRYSIKVNGAIANLADYSSLLPNRWQDLKPAGRASIGWDGQGTADAHSGDFRILAENVSLTTDLGLRPFDAKLEGAYSPQNIFFREFQLSNPQVQFNAFVTLASTYLQFQTIHLDLNGKSKLQGNVFVPVTFESWWRSRPFIALDDKQNFDVDLMLDTIDLGELQRAVSVRGGMSGNLSGRLATYGILRALQGKFEAQLRDFTLNDPRPLSADLRGETSGNSISLHLLTTIPNSAPFTVEAKLPLPFAEPSRSIFSRDQPISAKADFPAILLAKVPRYLTGKPFRDGIVSGNLTASGTLRNPKLNGEVALLNGRFAKAPGPIEGMNVHAAFHGTTATLAPAELQLPDAKLPFDAAIEFADTSNISLKLNPHLPVYEFSQIASSDCVSGINIFGTRRSENEQTGFAIVQELDLRGGIGSDRWTMTLNEYGRAQPLGFKNLFSKNLPLCQSDGETLQLVVPSAQKIEFGRDASSILRGRQTPPAVPNQLQLR